MPFFLQLCNLKCDAFLSIMTLVDHILLHPPTALGCEKNNLLHKYARMSKQVIFEFNICCMKILSYYIAELQYSAYLVKTNRDFQKQSIMMYSMLLFHIASKTIFFQDPSVRTTCY